MAVADTAPLALLLTAVAVAVLPSRAPIRRPARAVGPVDPLVRRAAFPAVGAAAALLLFGAPWWLAVLAGSAAGYAGVRAARRTPPMTLTELRSLAALLDVFAACLDAGLAPAAALTAVIDGPGARRPAGRGEEALAQAAALLQLGGQPSEAWRPAAGVPQLSGLAAAATRSATGGLTLADAAREAAAALRTACRATITDRAARAGVAMTAPLALCFLPAFLCLGLAPTVIGMVSTIRLW